MIGFITTAHYSEKYRKQGREYLEAYVESIRNVQKIVGFDYKIFVMDNESEIPFVTTEDYSVKRFENQKQGGLSRTWNSGCKLAYASGCEIFIVSNDDIKFTESINELIKLCKSNKEKENYFIGPVSNGSSTFQQSATGPGKNVVEYTEYPWEGRTGFPLNGFCQAFHVEFYNKFNVEGNLWNVDGTKALWGGEENDLFDRCTPGGMRSIVCEPWYVIHDKINGWRQLT